MQMLMISGVIIHFAGRPVHSWYFVCHQLLATGLSGLYSSLPRRLDYPSDDWNHFSAEDITACPALAMFLNSLEFCNAVVQVQTTSHLDRLSVNKITKKYG